PLTLNSYPSRLTPLARDQPLLRQRRKVLHRVVQVETRSHVQQHERERYRNHVHDHLLLLRHFLHAAHADPRHQERGGTHQQRKDVVRILQRDVFQPQERHTAELDRILEHEEEREEDRHWQQHGQAAGQRTERTHAVLLVHAHDLLLLLLRILRILLLRSLQLGLNALHPELRTHGLLVQRPHHEPHEHAEDNEHPAVADVHRAAHPEQHVHHYRGERLHDRLHETAVGIGILEVAA